MIDLFLRYAADPSADGELRRQVQAHIAGLLASAGHGGRQVVAEAEAEVRADPVRAFTFDTGGHATLAARGQTWHAGHFETPSIATLRQRAAQSAGTGGGRLRLWVWDGASPATDIGGLQATAGDGALFQVASQFNCLEAPSAYIVPVAEYFHDFTQGPRASISAFPATLLRHYSAPGPHGRRFAQSNGGRQINLLEDLLNPGVVRVEAGYLTA